MTRTAVVPLPSREHRLDTKESRTTAPLRGADSGGTSSIHARLAMASVNSLRCFSELVRRLGGDANALLRRANIDPALFANTDSMIEYRSLIQVLEYAAEGLSCPDFGLRLAVMQGGKRALGLIGVVMANSKTLGQAINYCAKHSHACTLATGIVLEPDRANHRLLIRVQILLEGMPERRQFVEQILALAHLFVKEVTGGAAHARKILMSHQPQSALSTYRAVFGRDVSFGEKVDGFVLTEADLRCPVVDPDPRVYEMATSFIKDRYLQAELPIHARVRSLILQYIGSKDCTTERIAAECHIHPRTMQRGLRVEGTSFDDIKDEVRRDLALRYIQNADMPLKLVAEKLGYAETSVLSRSCYRWFSATPRQLRLRSNSSVSNPASNHDRSSIGVVRTTAR